MDPENNWELDIDTLRGHITKKTRAIVINSPNNPTGYTIPEGKLKKIIDIAKQHDISVFSDEVYRFLEYREEDRLPGVCDIYDKGISLGVMSKSFGLPGLRIGWIVTKDNTLLKKMASFKDFTTICNSAPSEFLAVLALRHKEFILNRNLEIVKSNLHHLESFFEKHSNRFEWIRPKAGPLIFPRLTFTHDAEIFCSDLRKKKGILVMPGSQFNYSNNHVRIGFGRKNMPQILTKLEEYFTNLK